MPPRCRGRGTTMRSNGKPRVGAPPSSLLPPKLLTFGVRQERDVGREDGTAPQEPGDAPRTLLLTVGETAALLRTTRKAVYVMAERHQLPGVTRIGRRLLVRRDDLLSWLDERRAASPGGSRR
jgi:excisionase family DNA binding protein